MFLFKLSERVWERASVVRSSRSRRNGDFRLDKHFKSPLLSLKKRARATHAIIRFRRAKKSPDRRRLSTAYFVPLFTLCPERRRRRRRFCRYRLVTALDTFVSQKGLGAVACVCASSCWSVDNASAREKRERRAIRKRAVFLRDHCAVNAKRIQNALRVESR